LKQKIVFFTQSHKPYGGAPRLYLDLGSYIADNHTAEYDVFYLNYHNPIVEEDYKKSKLNICDVDKVDYSKFEDATFFVAINYVYFLLSKIGHLKKAKICVYFYHPQVFRWYALQLFMKEDNKKDILKLLAETSCCFMDKSNYLAIDRISNLGFRENYVPVTLREDPPQLEKVPQIVNKDRISVGWLGRVDGDKVSSINNFLDNLLAMGHKKKVDVHIIGDGNSKAAIKIDKYAPQIRVVFTSYMYGKERDDYIKKNVDIVVAMGISALDIAVLGIPTAVPLVSSFPFRDDKFSFLYDIKGYSLGWAPEDSQRMGCKNYTMTEIINAVYTGNGKETIGTECYEFARANFSIKNGARMLIESLKEANLTVERCLRCSSVKKQMRRFKIYSKLRRDDNYMRFHLFMLQLNRVKEKGNGGIVKFLFAKIKRMFSHIRRKNNA